MFSNACNDKLIIEQEIKLRLTYLAIYDRLTGKLVYYDKNKLVFDNYNQINFYTDSIKEKIEKDYDILTFKTIIYEEYPVKFIWGKGDERTFLIETKDC